MYPGGYFSLVKGVKMSLNEPAKTTQAGSLVYSVKDLLAIRWSHGKAPAGPPPDLAVLCYQRSLLDHARKVYRTQKVAGFFGELHRVKFTSGRAAVAGNFGIGAPAAVIMLEELAAFGVRQVVSIGPAGGLQADLPAGSYVICRAAFRDEGTSRHYLPAGDMVGADPGLTRQLEQTLSICKLPFRVGQVWTTDAPYRETRLQAESFQKEGFLAVDMETSALLAAGQALGIPVGAVLAISDSLAEGHWTPDFEPKRTGRVLQDLLRAVLGLVEERGKR
jgi:uridine phosphorylase